jgi:hypothetical protein
MFSRRISAQIQPLNDTEDQLGQRTAVHRKRRHYPDLDR